MQIIIQCASTKKPGAGAFRTVDGEQVRFVGVPEACSDRTARVARPDEPSDIPGLTWRDRLSEYNNQHDVDNPWQLARAYELYAPSAYVRLVRRFGIENIFILSAGWGLVRADYLLPDYDVTFSAQADAYKRRRVKDHYADFNHMKPLKNGHMVFFGGRDYRPLLYALLAETAGEKILFDRVAPETAAQNRFEHGWCVRSFPTARLTNWHYGCAEALIEGSLHV
jgi:hypothetical protein